ncbi:MAG TPA: hypothetical protein VM077_04220 [Candidatus Limnocylindrales bacterium]|nr:hypothetical protein [Candidatus Limnocylindrales bacterium]
MSEAVSFLSIADRQEALAFRRVGRGTTEPTDAFFPQPTDNASSHLKKPHLHLVIPQEEMQEPYDEIGRLLAPNVVESLVEDQRVPFELIRRQPSVEPVGTYFVIPPAGTRLGDFPSVDSYESLIVTFWPPSGPSRGRADVVYATSDQAIQLRERRSQALKKIRNP